MQLYPIVQNGRYGFIREDGTVAITPQYDSAMGFSEGFAGVTQNGKWAFVNECGDLLTQFQFDKCSPFSHGLALVITGSAKEYIDTSGHVAISTSYYRCGSFESDLARVMPDMYSQGVFIDRSGKIVLSGRNYSTSQYSNGLINCRDGSKWGYVNRNGDFEIAPQFASANPFSEELAAVAAQSEGLHSFIDTNGRTVIYGEFQGADVKFSEGLCAVWKNRFGYIDRNGKVVIPYRFTFADHFSDGLAVVQLPGSDLYGYIDITGTMVVEPAFPHASHFDGKLASVIVGDSFDSYHYGYIDRHGHFVWNPSR